MCKLIVYETCMKRGIKILTNCDQFAALFLQVLWEISSPRARKLLQRIIKIILENKTARIIHNNNNNK